MCEYCGPDETVINPWAKPEVGSEEFWDQVDAYRARLKEES